MRDWTKTLVRPEASIRNAIEAIDNSALRIALVADADRRLHGVVTDGDVRRGLLRGFSVEDPIQHILNPAPTVVGREENREAVLALMKRKNLLQIPVVDRKGRVVGLEVLFELVQPGDRDNWVVLMVGGLGTRLRPLTETVPKPLLHVGHQPILETILEQLLGYGFHRFYFSVNYKARMIEEYFGDGRAWGAEIRYLYEDEPLGTAGALRLLPTRPSAPFIVMNGDLLTKLNFNHFLDYHRDHRAAATMGVSEYRTQIPYGVIQTDHHRIAGIQEKPVQRFLINAGVYALEPEALDLIPDTGTLDMPELFNRLAVAGRETVAFPIREYWMDIGRLADFERANGEYAAVFGG